MKSALGIFSFVKLLVSQAPYFICLGTYYKKWFLKFFIVFIKVLIQFDFEGFHEKKI